MHGLELDYVIRWAGGAGEAGAHVERLTGRRSRVALWGELPVGWAGRLAIALANRGVDIRRGGAKHVEGRAWLAEFEIDADTDLDVASLDYLTLCRDERVSLPTDALELLDFDLSRSDTEDALELSLRAPDQLGFLGNLLGRLAFFSLFPEAMSVATSNGVAHDQFLLRGLGGAPPSAAIEQAVVKSLWRSSSSPPRPSSIPPPSPGRRPGK